MARAGKLKLMGGRMVSAKSKTGDPACSQAASAWQNSLRGNPVGMALSTAMQVLAQCRAKARALKQAGGHRSAGNELRAQALESRIAKGGPLTAKDRLAKARELRAQRGAKASGPAYARRTETPGKAAEVVARARDLRASRAARPAQAGPSLKEQAAKHRAGKGTPEERRAALLSRAKEALHRHAERKSPDLDLAGRLKAAGTKKGAAEAKKIEAAWPKFSKEQDVLRGRLKPLGNKTLMQQAAAKPLHEQALEAARRVPSEKRFGSKVFVHHAWQEYRKGGGKLGLSEFKSQLASSPEARMNMSRADLVQGMRRGDVKGSNVAYMGGEYNFIKVGEAGSGRVGAKIQPRPESSYHGKPPAAEKSRAADVVARARAMRAPKVPGLKEQAAKPMDRMDKARLMVGQPAATRNPNFAQGRYQEAARKALAPKGFKAREIKADGGTVNAQVKGIYAVHRSPDVHEAEKGNTHVVTHIPSGLAVESLLKLSEAKRIAASLSARKIDLGKLIDSGDYARAKRIKNALVYGKRQSSR